MTDPDATVVLPRPQAVASSAGASVARPGSHGRTLTLVAAGAVVAAGVAGAGAWYWLRSGAPETPAKPEGPAVVQPPPPTPAETTPRLAAADAIFGHRATAPTLFRLAENPRVFVFDFPDLDAQAATFNRVAALVEKVGQPRDRLLDDAALAAAIARSGDTAATYYYGHNYRGRDLERFFMLADRDSIALNPSEQRLRQEVQRLRGLVPAPGDFAIISVPGLESRVDPTMRRAILNHEIGHGHFFTNTEFAEHVAKVWREVFTEQERAAFRAFLEREGYDPALEEVMMNEAMAYLLFTPDARFFTPMHAGLTEARAEQLRTALRARAPL
ncbi:hypothetical protein GWK16_01675 [Roseomonas sp. JC162]|uniref:Uncharacterized protein n=1 Tax=Neoroseomonas marina TaxID=1232220 RepID=A0A848E8X8_9PROT|nr:hypothetical protein [Neoroseomonas marina]NMJ39933.1 hypothetical protein [Neoroseomonas marina]